MVRPGFARREGSPSADEGFARASNGTDHRPCGKAIRLGGSGDGRGARLSRSGRRTIRGIDSTSERSRSGERGLWHRDGCARWGQKARCGLTLDRSHNLASVIERGMRPVVGVVRLDVRSRESPTRGPFRSPRVDRGNQVTGDEDVLDDEEEEDDKTHPGAEPECSKLCTLRVTTHRSVSP